jgi:Sas10/Utp3/C1D family
LQEFQETLETLNKKLQPILEKVKSKQIETKHGMTYLEMKYNLLLSYCSFLSFYLLMKIEGKSVKDHPVIFKLAHIKTLIEKLKPLD